MISKCKILVLIKILVIIKYSRCQFSHISIRDLKHGFEIFLITVKVLFLHKGSVDVQQTVIKDK